MKKTLFAIAALLLATSASAQEAGKPFLGVGLALGGGSLIGGNVTIPAGTNKILIPINVSQTLRVEPFLSYLQNRQKDSTSPVGTDTTWESYLSIGAGVYLLNEIAPSVELYYGGRLSINRIANGYEIKSGGTTLSGDDSFLGFGLAAVGGADYFFSPRFALGVEAELGFDSIETATDIKETKIGTAAFLTARVFFK